MKMEIRPRRVLCWLIVCCLATAGGQLNLTATPKELSLGITDHLTVNCTYANDGKSDMTALISLFIYRQNDVNATSDNGEELASINTYVPHVNTILPDFNSSSGRIAADGVSYLELSWLYPAQRQSGFYVCTAQGIDNVGHTVSTSTKTNVTTRQPERDEILNKIKELNENLKSVEQKFSDLHSNLSANFYQFAGTQSKHDDDVNKTLAVLKTFEKEVHPLLGLFERSLFYPFNLTYGGDIYRILRAPVWGYDDAVALCESYGATLLEIDDDAEYERVEHFLNEHSGLTTILVAGRLVNNRWEKQYSDLPMFEGISILAPSDRFATNDCRILTNSSDWSLQNMPCDEIRTRSPYQQVNVMCESKA
ncbi:unnamed protein product [Lymnaea stagnalis]|uniref:C-type lectin domain-containing protein n=1 Tax=Lymnaea stagnalis TaxID=6523 RepID=A0AAV2I5Q5_LYMST